MLEHGDATPGAKLGHPLAQRRYGDLPPDDDGGDQRDERARIGLQDQHQRDRDHQLVGHGVEKRAEL